MEDETNINTAERRTYGAKINYGRQWRFWRNTDLYFVIIPGTLYSYKNEDLEFVILLSWS